MKINPSANSGQGAICSECKQCDQCKRILANNARLFRVGKKSKWGTYRLICKDCKRNKK